MKSTNRSVIFWAWKNRPSFIMRGRQIAQALKEKGINTEIRTGSSWFALSDVKDSLIVCVKSKPLFSSWLIKNNNKIIYDAIDFSSASDIPKNASAIITGTEYMRKKLEKINPTILHKTIYHHADPLLKPHHAGENVLKLVYNGAKESSNFIQGEVPDLNVVSFENVQNWREKIREYNAHFSARLDMNKSVIKLANVSSMNAIYLTGAEPGCVELLGGDYPFFFKDPSKLEKVLEDVKKLQESVGSTLWKDAKDRIHNTHSLLTLDASVDSYKNLFLEL